MLRTQTACLSFTFLLTSFASYSVFSDKAIAGQFGPVGGSGGSEFFYVSPSGYFTQIAIRSARRIDSLLFMHGGSSSYWFGGSGGELSTMGIGANQCITAIRGTTGIAGRRNTESVFSLGFVFSDGSASGQYGQPGERPFILYAPVGEEIIGFFGRAAREVDAIGIVTGPSRCR
jgi:Jacalin-like lectin domain